MEGDSFWFWVLFWSICWAIAGILGNQYRGGSGCIGGLVCFLFGPLGLFLILLSSDGRPICPYCASRLPITARNHAHLCAFCRNPLDWNRGYPRTLEQVTSDAIAERNREIANQKDADLQELKRRIRTIQRRVQINQLSVYAHTLKNNLCRLWIRGQETTMKQMDTGERIALTVVVISTVNAMEVGIAVAYGTKPVTSAMLCILSCIAILIFLWIPLQTLKSWVSATEQEIDFVRECNKQLIAEIKILQQLR